MISPGCYIIVASYGENDNVYAFYTEINGVRMIPETNRPGGGSRVIAVAVMETQSCALQVNTLNLKHGNTCNVFR